MTRQQPNSIAGVYGPNAGRRATSTARDHATEVTPQANPYLKTRVMSASPAELRLMLIDGAIRFAEQARDGLETRNYERSYEGFSRARAIITELIAGLNPESDPALCDRLTGLYTFLFTRLVEASSERSVEMIDEVINVLQTERETWKMLVESLALENSSAADMTEAPVMQAANNASGTSGSSLPTAGRIFTTG